MIIKRLENEYWYGGRVSDGVSMPVKPGEEAVFRLDTEHTQNQAMPLFLSSRGRSIWRNDAFTAVFRRDTIECPDDAELGDGCENLRSAYLAAMNGHFPFHNIALDDRLFGAPVFNTWIELTYNQNQKDILDYAKAIISHGFEPGVLMIDDGWSDSYGSWNFHSGKFSQPEKMFDELHRLGFKVMLWVCPFVTADTLTFRETESKGLLIKNPRGDTFITHWWNGYSTVLDMSNPNTSKWLDGKLETLSAAGADGFKFDAGDNTYYREDNITCGGVTPNEQSRLWAAYGEKYPLNEYRATFGAGGYSLFQRLCDKEHAWGKTGIAALIPDTLAQGITGHPFCCADMVGGGEYLSFRGRDSSTLDAELFVRHSGISCLMPSIQFSAAPWRYLSDRQMGLIGAQMRLRSEYEKYLEKETERSKKSGEPIARYMEYVFPHAGMETVTDQFMLGDDVLVAPVCQKGHVSRSVYVPRGKWKFGQKEITSGGERFELTPPAGLPAVLTHIEF